MAGAARVPARVMQFIADVGDREPVDHLGVRRRVGIQIHRGKVIRLVNSSTCTNHMQNMNTEFQTRQYLHKSLQFSHGVFDLEKLPEVETM